MLDKSHELAEHMQADSTLLFFSEVVSMTTQYINIVATVQHVGFRLFCFGWTVCEPPLAAKL